jgi:hypothetical protein
MFNPYTKAILGAIIVLLAGLTAAWDDSVLTTSEIFAAVGAAIAALGAIWAVNPQIKWLIGGLLAGLTSIGIALEDDRLSAQEIVSAVGATLVALYAVYATANTEASSKP